MITHGISNIYIKNTKNKAKSGGLSNNVKISTKGWSMVYVNIGILKINTLRKKKLI